MTRMLALALAMTLGWAAPALAATFERCGRTELKLGQGAVDGALEVALHAAAAVGDTPAYARWFGQWSRRHGEEVRANLKAVHAALGDEALKAVCLAPASVDCKDGVYAFVSVDRPLVVNLCPSFFAMPSMRDAHAGVGDQANGTREGTIIHELSHFPTVAHTQDHCYSRPACADMAARDPRAAIGNADSYQYFGEDAMIAFAAAAARAEAAKAD